MRYYAQLAQEQRYQIYSFLKAGFNQSQLARDIGVHKSTISRELKRNKGLRGYRPVQAHKLTQQRRQTAVSRKISDEDWQLVESLIRFDLSPEQAAARRTHREIVQIIGLHFRRDAEILSVGVVPAISPVLGAIVRRFADRTDSGSDRGSSRVTRGCQRQEHEYSPYCYDNPGDGPEWIG